MVRDPRNYITLYLRNKKMKDKLKSLAIRKIIKSPAEKINELLEEWIETYEEKNGEIKSIEELLGEQNEGN